MLSFYICNPGLIKKSGFLFPFVIENKAKVKLCPGSKIQLGTRIRIGNKKLPLLSAVPTNIYISENALLSSGKSVSIGPGVNIIAKSKAEIHIGDSTYFTSDSHIEAVESIVIGANCAISWGVTIIDSDHHEIEIEGKSAEVTQPVKIGDHVWVGCNATILKGTVIGDNSIVAAGSVVKGEFPPNSLIAGNPAKVIRENCNWK